MAYESIDDWFNKIEAELKASKGDVHYDYLDQVKKVREQAHSLLAKYGTEKIIADLPQSATALDHVVVRALGDAPRCCLKIDHLVEKVGRSDNDVRDSIWRLINLGYVSITMDYKFRLKL